MNKEKDKVKIYTSCIFIIRKKKLYIIIPVYAIKNINKPFFFIFWILDWFNQPENKTEKNRTNGI